jgi:hypothetical protein
MLVTLNGPVIAAGQSLSNAIDCSAVDRIIRIIVPSGWNGGPEDRGGGALVAVVPIRF